MIEQIQEMSEELQDDAKLLKRYSVIRENLEQDLYDEDPELYKKIQSVKDQAFILLSFPLSGKVNLSQEEIQDLMHQAQNRIDSYLRSN